MTQSLKQLFQQQLNDFYLQQETLSIELEHILNEVDALENSIAKLTTPQNSLSNNTDLPLPFQTLGTYVEKMEKQQKDQQLLVLAAELIPLQNRLDECLSQLRIAQQGMKVCNNALVQAEQLDTTQAKQEWDTLVNALDTKK